MTSVRSPRRKSPDKKNRSPRRKSPSKKFKKSRSPRRKSPSKKFKKSRSLRRKSPSKKFKKSRSLRRKSPVKKSRSPRRKSPVKKYRSPRRKSPVKKYRSPRRKSSKTMLKGGMHFGEFDDVPPEPPENTRFVTSKVVKPEVLVTTSKDTTAPLGTLSDAPEVLLTTTAPSGTLTDAPEVLLTTTKDITKVEPTDDVEAFRKTAPGDINDLEQNLYRVNDPDFNSTMENLRDFYIKLWNKYNDDYLPGKKDALEPKKLTLQQQIWRNKYKEYTENYNNKQLDEKLARNDLLYEPGSTTESNNMFVDRRLLFVYSVDSINRIPYRTHFDKTKIEKFQVSRNSFEIHCTTLKIPRKTGPEEQPLRFFGHVTLILTRDLTIDEETKIMNCNKNDHAKAQAQKYFSEIYHYGVYESEEDGSIVEDWWRGYEPFVQGGKKPSTLEIYTEEYFNNMKFGDEDHYPRHNSVGKLMKEYYLYCINTCPVKVAFTGAAGSGYSTLTLKDFTNWGLPKRILDRDS